MAVSRARALAEAHLSASWNWVWQRTGATGLATLSVAVALVATFVFVPTLTLSGVFGFSVGRALRSGYTPRSTTGLAFELAAIAMTTLSFLGGLSGLAGGAGVPSARLQLFPVGRSWLFCADVCASALRFGPLLLIGVMTMGVAGACVAAPAASPMLLWALVTHVVALLAAQRVLVSLMQRASSLKTETLTAALALMTTTLIVFTSNVSWFTFERLTCWMPARWALGGASALARGRWTWGALAPGVFGGLALAVGLFALAWQLGGGERAWGGATPRRPERLWSFRSPLTGVARLQWVSLVGSLHGRISLMTSVIAVALIQVALLIQGERPLPLIGEALDTSTWLGVAYGYVAFGSGSLYVNQFGLDGHGVKALLLLPIEATELLCGKLLGCAAWFCLQASLLTTLLAVLVRPPAHVLALGLLQFTWTFLLMSMMGQSLSIMAPRSLVRSGARAAGTGLLETVGISCGLGAAYLAVWGVRGAARAIGPAWELPALALGTLALIALAQLVTRLNARLLNRRRQAILEMMGA